MFALILRFPAGRYHATPWGRNVNEADVAWPPEPWRLLRALVATWWQKGDPDRWPRDTLARLIEALAETPPVFHLPEDAVHSHTRHYMPVNGDNPKLIFDAFAHLPADSEIVAAWPHVTLDDDLLDLAWDLANGLGYLGRAESWVEAAVSTDQSKWRANCHPVTGSEATGADGSPVRVLAPLSATEYADKRTRLMAETKARLTVADCNAGKKAPTPKALAKKVDGELKGTLPESLLDALSLDTGDLQKVGWTRPPASREVVYVRPPLSPTARRRRHRAPAIHTGKAMPTVVRWVLTGRPRPRVEDTIRIGELMRVAAMSTFGRDTDTGRFKAPPEISGHGADNGALRDDPAHAHAFWLPEDADNDGWIDHVTVWLPGGFDVKAQAKLSGLRKLWVNPKNRTAEDAETHARAVREWHLVLEGFGQPEDFMGSKEEPASRLFGTFRTWTSLTPFLAAGHLKKGGYEAEIRRLLVRRGILGDAEAQAVHVHAEPAIHLKSGKDLRPIHFHRFRSRSGERQPDSQGTFLTLTFPSERSGPMALGFGSHFGLGLFGTES
ncbi:type I-G CRISPR-associated protein Csb2 [Roseospira visakhapatnamensis]|uniref:CRISPR-associated protein Csb2 n=1 Tax=Roseospira visakhapatnamensis TaxID=390880 RepID=A0A7W6WAY5_9PROT|nr:type I-U CRISPR-associated protein Csb2 [Roseospira visakhapatnamensis]MBB4266976.1 CRISPR-associated protein Csb2 [Roseospira visakhapatnamensis]